MKTNMGFCVLAGLWLISDSARSETKPTRDGDKKSAAMRSVTGPTEPINRAVAAGATATVTLQPVQPKTFPSSSYPPGSSIAGQTLTLGSVPARVWLEVHVTGWKTETLRYAQVAIDATDLDGDGGGYDGDTSDCYGAPAIGAGDIVPAMQACGGTCQGNPAVVCISSDDCTAGGTTGPCNNAHLACRNNISGITSPCPVAEPSRCARWDGVSPGGYFPAGLWCEPGFQDKCDPEWIHNGIIGHGAVILSSISYLFGMHTNVNEFTPDFQPTYLGTLVLDVPSDAKGSYHIDINQNQTFMCEFSGSCPPPGDIPIVAFNEAVIEVVSCVTSADCNDDDACTVDACVNSCECTHTPIVGWNPETECCNPMNGVQGLIPQSTPCRTGGCSLGGSSGSPTFTNVADGTGCSSIDPCYGDGQCQSGICQSEEYPGADCPKVRFITFDGRLTPGNRALRIKFVSLHHPDPPYSGAPTSDFSAHEGEFRWVGPPASYVESTADPREVFASFTQCQPHYGDWFFYDLLHITGAVIVPSSIYQIQSIPSGLDINNEANYSAPVTISTSRWGDLVIPLSPPSTTVQPDVGDIAEIVDKFKNTSQPCTKPRALMVGGMMGSVPNLSGDVTFSDISAVVDANRGLGYPYPWPMPCP